MSSGKIVNQPVNRNVTAILLRDLYRIRLQYVMNLFSHVLLHQSRELIWTEFEISGKTGEWFEPAEEGSGRYLRGTRGCLLSFTEAKFCTATL